MRLTEVFLFRPAVVLLPALVAMILAWLGAGPLWSQPPAEGEPLYGREIAEVEYEGLEHLARSRVDRVNPLRAGQPYTRVAETQALEKIFALGFFKPDIQTSARLAGDDTGRVIVTIRLEENPLIEELQVVGNSKVREQLVLSALPFKKGDIVPIDARQSSERAIRDLYRRQGYTDVSSRLEVERLTEGAVAVRIEIDEGGRVLVKDIEFVGNETYSDFRLGFHTVSKGSFLFIRNYLDRNLLESDIDEIRNFYLGQGFLDVQVSEGDHQYNADRTKVTLYIEIEEGSRYRLGDVEIRGHTLFTTDELREPFLPLIGDHYDRQRLDRALQQVREMYGDAGWILASIDQDFSIDRADTTVTVQLVVDEGQRIRVGAIKRTERILEVPESELGPLGRFFSRLAPPVKDEVVLRNVRLEPGEVWTLDEEEASLRRLRRLRVFKSVRIQSEPTDDPMVRDANVVTEVDNTGIFLIRGGVGSGSGAFISAQLTERNLFGEARGATISGTIGSRARSISLGYLDRDFRESGNTFSARIYHADLFRRGYDSQQTGLTTELTIPIEETLTQSWRLRVANIEIDPDEDDLEEELDDYVLAAVRYSREIDLRDDWRFPTHGYAMSGGVEAGTADTFFVQLTGNVEWHKQIFADVVYSLDLTGGITPVPSDRDDLGLEERFFLGGSGDLRGYAFRGAGPKADEDDDLALGGLTKILARNEVSFPVGLDNFRAVLFLDAGMLDEDFPGFDTPRFSTGIGARYRSNLLEAGLDFGFALNRQSDDDTQLIHFILESGL